MKTKRNQKEIICKYGNKSFPVEAGAYKSEFVRQFEKATGETYKDINRQHKDCFIHFLKGTWGNDAVDNNRKVIKPNKVNSKIPVENAGLQGKIQKLLNMDKHLVLGWNGKYKQLKGNGLYSQAELQKAQRELYILSKQVPVAQPQQQEKPQELNNILNKVPVEHLQVIYKAIGDLLNK